MRKREIGIVFGLVAGGAAMPAGAEVYTVGPSGRFTSIQAALTHAAQTPVNPTSTVTHEIRVQRGTYPENLRTPNPCCGRRVIRIRGGWNSTFTSTTGDPAGTVVDGRDRGRVFTALDVSEGQLELSNLTLSQGYLRAGGVYGVATGAGLRASLRGNALLILSSVHVRDHTIRGEGTGSSEGQGAGAMVLIEGSADLLVQDSVFRNNFIVPGSTSMASYGAGLAVQIYERGGLTVWRSEFATNGGFGTRLSDGGGLFATVDDNDGGGIFVEDSYFHGNVVTDAIGQGAGAALRTYEGGGGRTAFVSRCRFLRNRAGRSQLSADVSDGSRFELSDSLVAGGRGGLRLLVNNATAHVTNATVADNELRGIQGSVAGGLLTVFNTIASLNAGGDMSLTGSMAHSGFNLVGIDPVFKPGTYDLDGGSPAADAGINTPPAGLGIADLGRHDRVYNGTVDIGADEWTPY
jgi:hypothetical protein